MIPDNQADGRPVDRIGEGEHLGLSRRDRQGPHVDVADAVVEMARGVEGC